MPAEGSAAAAGLGQRPAGWRLSWHLAALCLAVLAPMLAIGGVLVLYLASAERARHEMDARQAAWRLTAVLDRELSSLQTLLRVLATSDHLQAGDVGAFIARAAQVPRPPGAEIALHDARGRPVADTGAGRAAIPGGPPDAPVSGLMLAGPGGQASFVITAPANLGGAAARLSLIVPLAHLEGPVQAATVPRSMTASVTDAGGHILARSHQAARLVGGQVAPELRIPPGAAQGWRESHDADGEAVVMAFSRSSTAGWTAAVFMPASAFAAPLRRLFWSALALALALAVLVAGLASLFARRISRPIAGLAAFAGGAALPEHWPAGPVREVDAVGRALLEARTEARERLRRSEDLLRTLDRAQVLVREPGGRITIWTSGCEHLYGWRREEALGHMAHDLLETHFALPPEQIMDRLLRTGEWQGELRQRRRDGSEITVISHWALRSGTASGPQAVVETSHDISALREAEAALRLNRDLLASVLDASIEPISACDLKGRFVILNEPAARLLGSSAAAAVGRTVEALLPGSPLAATRAVDADVAASGRGQVIETELPDGDGGARVLLSSKTPWRDGAGRICGVVTVSRDITARRQAMARSQQLQEELLHVSRLSAMGALAAELAHELNQPLTAVANFADAARRLLGATGNDAAPTLPAAREAMAEATEQAIHAGRIVRRLRGFIGRGETDRRPVVLGPLVEEAVRLAMTGSGRQGVALELRLEAAAALVVAADRVQVQQVVVNLVRNALEAMGGSPRRRLSVTAAREGAEAVLRVADTGPGIAAEVAPRLFEPFVSTKPEGMGIGLSICRSILGTHGGRLSVTETPGGGATFTVALPLAPEGARAGETSDG
ncbi:ATP-binding protein [Teichococcus aestuarii]|uniref:histidine kinase n=1 Tax=Teichococcus aestuarii TaxID=568898 RepID=A0A2U1UYE6_9PROT|nr:ATP-binding protein [Pseudoroseomonas aestuarii]PWC26675.1 hypothetical protein CR165_21970 [Pseudoroseomonas aestuarii]